MIVPYEIMSQTPNALHSFFSACFEEQEKVPLKRPREDTVFLLTSKLDVDL